MRIKCAAIWHKGVAHEGRRHHEIGLRMLKEGICGRPYPGGSSQGFVTDDGQFLNREDAMMVAILAGQVVKGKTHHPRQLFSEDLDATQVPS